ncbi:hypothetical protein WDU99_15415 [Microbacterium sp. Mu-80]|uniref:Transposase IS111A/IS1328/IS1533 N-terminal domain-containing protein n=1 Tax=Microbacterium bandirmense TaxID=3122050 RepID=A0ABU8LG99_9MICO
MSSSASTPTSTSTSPPCSTRSAASSLLSPSPPIPAGSGRCSPGRTFGKVLAFGIEGTGSYGATLTSFLRRHGRKAVEAGRPDRRQRRMNGKPDTLDAENAARSVLAPAAEGGILLEAEGGILLDQSNLPREDMAAQEVILRVPATRREER